MEKDVSAIGGLFLTIMSDLRVRRIRLWIEILRFFIVLWPCQQFNSSAPFIWNHDTRLWNKGLVVQLEWTPP